MNDFVLHPDTQEQLGQLLSSPLHAYLFIGPIGVGKTSLAKYCMAQLISADGSEAEVARWGSVICTQPDKKKISIAEVKTIGELLNQKKPTHINKKVVVIDGAENLSIEAANALLKILEEPADDSVIILVSAHPDRIPLTVRSRVAAIRFQKPTQQQIEDFFGNDMTLQLSEVTLGYPAHIARLMSNPADCEQAVSLRTDSIKFLSEPLPQKLVLAQQIVKSDQVLAFLQSLGRVVQTSSEADSRLQAEALLFADTHLYNSGNPRFVLEHLALELS